MKTISDIPRSDYDFPEFYSWISEEFEDRMEVKNPDYRDGEVSHRTERARDVEILEGERHGWNVLNGVKEAVDLETSKTGYESPIPIQTKSCLPRHNPEEGRKTGKKGKFYIPERTLEKLEQNGIFNFVVCDWKGHYGDIEIDELEILMEVNLPAHEVSEFVYERENETGIANISYRENGWNIRHEKIREWYHEIRKD